ncbi:MAG: GntR family transcriptional regulator [Candidatus Limnocylindrales bacterium]|jgi:GntR family transcriptional regulator
MVRFRLERGPVPLHHQVYLDLRAALAADEWKPGGQLPTERELAERYGCSLITVRRALNDLAREGRLERTRGRGTFVTELPIVRDIAGQIGFADEVRALGYEPYTVVVAARFEGASPVVAAALGIPVDTSVHYLERVRGADNVPLLLEQVRLPAYRLPGLLDHDYRVESLWDVLENDYHLPIGRRQETLSAVVPSAREARLLGLRTRRPSIQLEGTAFTTGGEPIEYSRTVVSPERARYFVESTGSRIRAVTPLDLPPRSGVAV